MNIVLKDVRLFHPVEKSYSSQSVDVFISEGIIVSIGAGLEHPERDILKVSHPGLCVSLGWVDLAASYADPGLEHKEDIETGLLVAAKGGFTGVGVLPNTQPTISDKKGIHYLMNKSKNGPVKIYPYGSVTVNCEGTDLTEMIDMHHAGAVAFTDGEKTLWNSDILYKSLMYLKPLGGVLINSAQDKWLSMHGLVHEGEISTRLGLPGIPDTAEEIAIQRDLKLLELSGGSLHFSKVSSKKGLELIIQAKEKGLKVTCDVASYHLLFSDEQLPGFDTNYKTSPPLRSVKDREFLVQSVLNHSVDCVCSNHLPQDTESKDLEFDLSAYGIINQQTCFSTLVASLGIEHLEVIVDKLSYGPRRVLNLGNDGVNVGEVANLTLFVPEMKWKFDSKSNVSKSFNSPFLNQEMQGKVLGIVNQGYHHFDELLHVDKK